MSGKGLTSRRDGIQKIEPASIIVYSLAGPMPPITNDDLQNERVLSRNYRNRRIGDFLKELDMTEGRSTGFPKIFRAMRNNGSPDPVFKTDGLNQYFLAELPIHPAFIGNNVAQDVVKNVVDRLDLIVLLLKEDNTLSAARKLREEMLRRQARLEAEIDLLYPVPKRLKRDSKDE